MPAELQLMDDAAKVSVVKYVVEGEWASFWLRAKFGQNTVSMLLSNSLTHELSAELVRRLGPPAHPNSDSAEQSAAPSWEANSGIEDSGELKLFRQTWQEILAAFGEENTSHEKIMEIWSIIVTHHHKTTQPKAPNLPDERDRAYRLKLPD